MYNEDIKRGIMKWRNENRDRYNAYKNMKQREYYARDKEIVLEKKKEIYHYNKYLTNTNPRVEFSYLRNIDIW